MSMEKDKVVHEVDGIQEYDNRLPRWWVWILFGTVAFAVVYWFHYHVFESGTSVKATFEQEMGEFKKAQAEKAAAVTPEALTALSKDTAKVAEGKEIFTANCVACHGQSGGGTVGPNLTDEYWLHGGQPDKIFKTISNGVPNTAMLAWGSQLGAQKVQSVTAYVLTLRNTNVPGGKAPQGEKM